MHYIEALLSVTEAYFKKHENCLNGNVDALQTNKQTINKYISIWRYFLT